ncbi:hypothetical protein EsH8_V_000145 [Colletotrichum jinshuiense]
MAVEQNATEDANRLPPRGALAPKSGSQKLKVGIVGAGIGGLMAAVALLEGGHDVESIFYEDPDNLDKKRVVTCSDFKSKYGAPYCFFHRVDLHSELKRLAVDPTDARPGAARLHLGTSVSGIDQDGTIHFEDGTSVQKDVVVASDGIRSSFLSTVVGSDVPAQHTMSILRLMIPVEDLRSDPETTALFEDGLTSIRISHSTNKSAILYGCRGGSLQNVGIIYAPELSTDADGNDISAREDFVHKVVEGFPKAIQSVCLQAKSVGQWNLMTRKPLERLARGRVVLMGDAAHPMLPVQAQGAAMAVEDAAALGVLLSNVASKDDVSARLELFNELRVKRVAATQTISSMHKWDPSRISDEQSRYFDGRIPPPHPPITVTHLLLPRTEMRVYESLAVGLLQAGLASAQTKYADNQVPVSRDSELVSKLFPDVDVELLSPAFANPETVPGGWSNGTAGPTDQDTLESFLSNLADNHGWLTYHQPSFTSEDGRSIPYVNLSTSSSTQSSSDSGKLRIWLQGGVHGNEPAGDQAILALLGKFASNETWTLSVLAKADILVLPRYNPDGVAYFQRELASNYDPNRDHALLQRRQTRDVKRLLAAYDPHVFLDAHEYTASQQLGASRQWVKAQDVQVSHVKNPNIHADIRALGEDLFTRAIQDRVRAHGLRTSAYFTASGGTDLPVLTEPSSVSRAGHNSAGLLQAVSFLTETRGIRLADQHFQRRVAAGLIAAETLVQTAVDNAETVYSTIENARRAFAEGTDDIVVVDHARVTDATWDFIDARNGTVVRVPVQFRNSTPTAVDLARARPEAYVFPRAWADVAERLEVLGVEVETLADDFAGEAEVLTVETLSLAAGKYEGVVEATLTTSASRRAVRVPRGGFRVSTRQKNAAFAFVTLEPENNASFARYNVIDLEVGDEYPVYRVLAQ